MGFHVFFTVMSVILKDKFKFGPQDYSNYFAFVGLFYAASQLLSKRLINRFAADPTWMVVTCTLFLMMVRHLHPRPHDGTLSTPSLPADRPSPRACPLPPMRAQRRDAGAAGGRGG